MRIVIIVPTFNYKYTYPSFLSMGDFPTGFAFLASALKSAGHQVFGLNLNNDPNYPSAYEMVHDKILKTLHEVQPELICVGGLCTDFKFLKDAFQIIRKEAPNIPIVCGGGIINNDTEFIFNTLKPDFCVIEEGEETLVQLVKEIESGSKNYEPIGNLGYWKNGNAKFTKQHSDYIDINLRSFPDYEPFGIRQILDDYSMAARNLYRYIRPNPRPVPIVTARQCPFNCTFCVHKKRQNYRARSIENIMQEITQLHEKYNFNILLIIDELFAVNKTRMKEFCGRLLEARKNLGWDFNWMFQTHASASLDRETLKMAKESGCYFFSYGIESASPRVLESMNKKSHPSQIIGAIEAANDVGIGFGGNFIFGDVAETPETIAETMDFFSKHCQDIQVWLDFIQPYPGSKLFEECLKNGLFKDKLEYYEHIAERIWNMTSIPDKFWIPWAYLMVYVMKVSRSTVTSLQSYPWTKSTNAISCLKEDNNNAMGISTGMSFYKITAKCPHCNQELFCRELMSLDQKNFAHETEKKSTEENRAFPLFELLKKFAHGCNKLRQVMKLKRLKLLVKIIIWYLMNFKNQHFKLMIKSMAPLLSGNGGGSSFDTGCPHCNKRFKIILSTERPGIRFNAILEKFLFRMVWLLSKG